MAEGIQENTAKAVMPLLIFPLFLSLLTIIQPINITHVEGLADDFSDMILEAVTANSTYDVPYDTVAKQDGEWILVNATLPEENYTLNVLSSSSTASPAGASHSSEPYITDVSYQEGLLPDFSNLLVSFERTGGPSMEIPFAFIGLEPGSWATIAIERAPLDGESIIFSARVGETAPSVNHTGEISPEPEPPTPEEGNETGFTGNETAMNETPDAGIPEPEPSLNETGDGILNETDGGVYVSDDSENSTLLIPGNYTIEAINETNETISLYANLDSLENLTNETAAPAAIGKSGPPDIPPGWGDPANQSFQIHGSKNRSSAANITLVRGGSEVSFTIGKGKNVVGIPHGRYGVKVKSDENLTGGKEERPFASVEEITLSNVDMSAGEGFDLGLEYISPNEIPFGKSARQAFAIDPTSITFDSGEVSVRAKGTELYKCAEWDFEGQTCTGSWEWQADLVPGEIYTIQIGPDDPAYAEYNVTYGAPRCGNSSSPCYANSSLLQSRDTLATPEPNQPNTLDSCADGALGTYLTDESVENITITSLNGSTFNAGDTVNVTATVYCYDNASDNINFLYTSSASSPSWTTIGYTDPCPATGFNTITKTFVLDAVPGEHAVRVINQFLGDTAATCGAGAYDDNDDVAFMVNGTEIPQPGDAIIAYRSNTGVFGTNSPKIRFWNASGAGAWGGELELQSAGSPVRFARAAWSPLSSKVVVVTQSDDGNLDGYVCMANCSRPGSWSYSSNIGAVLATTPPRRFDIAFETSTGDLILTYSVVSVNTARDLAYKVLPSGTSSLSGLTEQYLDDSIHATNLVYSWVRMDSKPGNSQELALVAFDATDSDINSWIWNGSAWNDQTEISNNATSTAGYEALAVRYAADGSVAMVMGAEGANGTVDSKYWNGSAWSSIIAFDVDGADLNDVRWANLKADPASDDLQAVFIDNGADLTTAYWSGSTWSVTTGMDNATDSAVARSADFEWNLTGSVGRLVWATDGAGTALSQRPCTPQCTGTTATISSYAGSGMWLSMWRNPSSAGNVRILSARLNSNFDIGSFTFSSASAFSNYGDAAMTADTTVSTFEAYSIAFNTSDATPPFINFTAPTPLNNTVIYVNYSYINVTVTDDTGVGTVTLEWNGTNQTINFTSGTEWGINKTGLVPGAYTYRVFASDISGNLNVTETRMLVYGSRPSVIVLDPQGETFGQHSYIPIAINATDSDGISTAIATITLPNGTKENITLVIYPPGDDFNYDTMGIAWFVENWSISPSQTCVADINGTVPGKAFTSLSGDGSPLSDTYCSLVTIHPLYGDFDLNVSFDILASDGVDNAINFKLTEHPSSFSSKQAFMSLGNWTGEGRTYDVFVDDGSASGYVLTRDTDDTAGKFRITRSGDNFTFYIWNNTDSTWTLENSSILNLSKVLFITMESESAYSGWGTMNVSWDNLTIIKSPYYVGSFNDTEQIGLYNISFFVNDTLNAVNDSEKANFTIAQINHRPTVPFILAPTIGQNVFGMFNITWSSVTDEENDTVQFNITLLNPDGSDNASIVADYGNISSNKYLWNTSVFPDGNYSMRIVAYENATAELLSASNTMAGTFQINNTPNTPPSVIVLAPLGGAYQNCIPVSLSINASDTDGISVSIGQVTYPNSSSVNITLGGQQPSDSFDNNTMGAPWFVESSSIGPAQTCVADIDTTVPGKAFTSLSGDGSPESDDFCSLISNNAIDGDFDISVDFNIEASTSADHALNFQVTRRPSSANVTRMIFMSLSNWTGVGQQYEIFVDDGNYSEYILQRPTNDTSGRFRMVRIGDNFTFYTWNASGSSWYEENVSSNVFNFSRAVFVTMESESAADGWGTMNASWDNFTVSAGNQTFGLFNDTCAVGLYNVTFFVNDSRGAVNGSETTNFTVFQANNRPSKPFIILPGVGSSISGAINISWAQVTDFENDTLWFNITLLNSDFSVNSSIITDYGNSSSIKYLWDTTAVPDGEYSLMVQVYENNTAEGYSNSDVLMGTFFINNNVPSVIVISPLGGTYPDSRPIPIVINATDSDGIDTAIATIHHPVTNTTENITLYPASTGDDFSSDAVGTAWFVENSSISPSQVCVADMNGTVPGKAFTSLSGDGSPYTDTYCSIISANIIYGDFDLNVSFEILASDGVDNAINFKLTEANSSFSSSQVFMSLGNWTGEGRTYDVFVDDASTSGYIFTRETDDTAGKFRIQRIGDNFTFYTWNNTDSSWTLENSSTLNLSQALFMTMESESAYSGWGVMNVTWDNLSISSDPYYSNVFYDPGHYAVLHNITFFVNDTRGGVNDTEITNFTLYDANSRPTTPFLLNPTPGLTVSGLINITWSSVIDLDNDTLLFNITLLNSDGSDNATIISDYGNASATKYLWDTSAYPDGEYSMRVTVYENETADGLDNSYTLAGTFFINNGIPSVIVIAPLGGDYPDCLPVSISINASDTGGIDTAIATVTLPDTTSVNISLDGGQTSDNFSVDSMGTDWIDEATLVGPSQTCTVDIDTSIPGAAYTSLEGPDGLPLTTTLCSALSSQAIDGDFDISIDFNITGSSSIDHALNFQVLETQSSADATKLVFMTLSNWTGLGQNYEIYVNDGDITDYVMQRPTNDTSGRFRIVREANNFTFFIWNNTASAWDQETVDYSEYNLSRALYVSFESESDYPGWGAMNVSWDNFNATDGNNTFAMFTDTCQLGLYNVSFFVNDTLGSVNSTESTNFTTLDVNNPPSSPYILVPSNGEVISGLYNITGTQVFDQENDSLRMNITLLNPDYTFNSTIASDIGNATTTSFEWDTTTVPDGVYSLEIVFYENETPEGLSSSDTLQGNFTIDNNQPYLQFEPPTEISGSTVSGRDYILVNVSAIDVTLNEIQIFLFNSSGDQIDSLTSGSSPAFANFSGLPEGLYYFNATANDLAGFDNSTETRNVTLTYIAIDGVTGTPDPNGFGLNVTITANVSNASSVLVGITPPGGSELNYSMANVSASQYVYNFTGWVNGTYLYRIYANGSSGVWVNSTDDNFTLFQNISLQAKTLKDYYMANERINITDPEFINLDAPMLTETSFGGGWMPLQTDNAEELEAATKSFATKEKPEGLTISARVRDAFGVRRVDVVIPTRNGDETIPLALARGTATDGIWQAKWVPHDLIGKHFVAIIEAENFKHINDTSYVSVGDPPGIWIIPTSDSDPTGLWSNRFNARDGNTHTYSDDNSNPGSGWGSFIYFNVSQIQSDRVRVWADWGAQVGSVDVDVYDGVKWINVHEGNITNLAWNELSFNTTNITGGRFRYNYTVGGWIYWLYEFQFYNVSTYVNIPVVATRSATSMEETTAILHGEALSDGGDTSQVRFLYGNASGAYTNSTPWEQDMFTHSRLGKMMRGLDNGQTYYFIAQINNSAGQSNGSELFFTTGPPPAGWVTPTGYEDSAGRWDNEPQAFDDELSSETSSFHQVNDVNGVWSSYLYLNRTPSIMSRRIRFNAKATDVDMAEIGVFANGSWNTVYNASFIDSTWTEAAYNLSNVSQARIRFRAVANNRGFEFRLSEFDFFNSPLTPPENQSKLENFGPTYASCYLFMKTQFWNGSTWLDDDVVVNETTPRILEPTDVLKLDLIWNPYNYSTSNLSFATGVYRIYSACHDNESNVLMDINGSFVNHTYNFTYDTTNPIVNITSPLNGTNYTLTSTIPIRVNVTEDFSVASVLANVSSPIGYEMVTLVFNPTSELWEYNYSNTNYVGIYTIRAIANDTSGNVNDTEFVQVNVIDVTPPTVYLDIPSDGATYSPTTTTNITFRCNVTDDFNVNNISLFITDPGNVSFSLNSTIPVSGVSTFAEFFMNITAGNYTWNCLSYDSEGNSAWGAANRTLTIQFVRPTMALNKTAPALLNVTDELTFLINFSTTFNGTGTGAPQLWGGITYFHNSTTAETSPQPTFSPDPVIWVVFQHWANESAPPNSTYSGNDWEIYAMHSDDNAQTWSNETIITNNSVADIEPNLVFDYNNEFIMAYQEDVGGQYDLFISNSTDGLTWTKRQITNTTYSEDDASIEQDIYGMYYVVFNAMISPDTDTEIYLMNSTNLLNWSTPLAITNNAFPDGDPDILEDNGTIYLAWTEVVTPGTKEIFYSTATTPFNLSEYTLNTVQVTNSTIDSFEPSLFIDPYRQLFISYNTWNSTNDTNRSTMEIMLANSSVANDSVWSLIQVTHNSVYDEYPGTVQDSAGLFYLFFAHDNGSGLRLVHMDRVLGDADARNVTIWDAIPPNTALVPGSITGGGVESNGTIRWTLGGIHAGRNAHVSFKVTVNSSVPDGTLINNTAFMNYSDSNGSLVETLNSTSSTMILLGCPVITSPGVFNQISDFTGAPNGASPLSGYACVKIISSDVIYDCNGYSINGNGTAGATYGILENGSLNNVTIMNCPDVSGYSNGFYVYNSTNGTVSNSTARGNNASGFSLDSSGGINLTGNLAENNSAGYTISSTNNSILSNNNATFNNGTGDGIRLLSSNNITIDPSYFCNNTGNGITVNNSNNTVIDDSVACNNTQYGIEIIGSNNTLINRSQVYNNTFGVFADSSPYSTFSSDNVSGNSVYGIIFRYSDNSTVFNNTANGNGFDAISNNHSNYANISFNTAFYNGGDAIFNFNSTGSRIISNNVGNTTGNSSSDGLDLVNSSYTIVLDNNITNVSIGIRCDYCRGMGMNNTRISLTSAGIGSFNLTGSNITHNDISRSTYGLYLLSNVAANNFSDNSIYNNTYGAYLTSASNNFTRNNITNNSNTGVWFDSSSTSANLASNYVCFNGLDIDNQGSGNSGALDRCDSFISWAENGHLGCEYSCSSMWHRFFGNANGTIVLTDAVGANMVYSWNATAMNVYFTDFDSAIDWQALQAIGRTTANASAVNDFIELDTAFNTSAFDDNITKTYSSDGSAPLETRNYTVYGRPIDLVPIANSTAFNTVFRTGILWDTSDGGTEYTNAINQSTVWMVAVNASSADTYGTYDFLVQVPETLATYEGGNDVISVYVELK